MQVCKDNTVIKRKISLLLRALTVGHECLLISLGIIMNI